MAVVHGRDNRSTEWAFRLALMRANISGWAMYDRNHPGRPDFHFRARRIAVFIDGCFWYACPACRLVPKKNVAYWRPKLARNVVRDKSASRALRRLRYRVVRIWEHLVVADCPTALQRLSRKA